MDRLSPDRTTKERIARCCCGGLSLSLQGEPERVIRCHCHYCQRRTGSAFQVSAWFFEDQIVSRTGNPRIFNDTDNNAGVVNYAFCGRCGSTVYWTIRGYPGLYSVAVGCFADGTFPPPNFEHNEKYRHAWVSPLETADRYQEFPPREVLAPRRITSSSTPVRNKP